MTGTHCSKVRNLRKAAETLPSLGPTTCSLLGTMHLLFKDKFLAGLFCWKNVSKQNWVKNKFGLGSAKFLCVMFMLTCPENIRRPCLCVTCNIEDTVICVALRRLSGVWIGRSYGTPIYCGFSPSLKTLGSGSGTPGWRDGILVKRIGCVGNSASSKSPLTATCIIWSVIWRINVRAGPVGSCPSHELS